MIDCGQSCSCGIFFARKENNFNVQSRKPGSPLIQQITFTQLIKMIFPDCLCLPKGFEKCAHLMFHCVFYFHAFPPAIGPNKQ